MLRRTNVNGGQQVEFAVASDSPVSVVGDFNAWDPDEGALTPGGDAMNGDTMTWTTTLAPGRYAFRYLRDGEFFDDAEADAFEPNGFGGFHGVLVIDEQDTAPVVEEPAAATKPKAAAKPRARVAKKAAPAASAHAAADTPSAEAPVAEAPAAAGTAPKKRGSRPAP